MDQRFVRSLEEQLEAAIAEQFAHPDARELPLIPSRQTLHLMAKAAVTVYEAAVANHHGE